MTRLRAWLARQERRAERWPRLADALVTDRGARYAAYRVRYALLRVGLRTALHIVELAFFSLVFPLEWLAPVFLVRAGSALFTALWWGALEGLRERVRALARARRLGEAALEIDGWLVTSFGVAALVQLAAWLWAGFGPDPVGGFSIFDAYALATALRVGLDAVTRTYHSGIFALRRVYRPLSSLLLVDFLDLAAPILLWFWFGTWSFAASVLGVGVLRAVLLVYYTRRAYRRSGLQPRRPAVALARLRRGAWRPGWARAATFAIAAAAGQVDALVLFTLILFSSASAEEAPLRLVATLFVLSPLLSAGVGWARVFYFDFKRLERDTPALLVRRFERLLGRVAFVFPLLAWGLALGVAGVLVPEVLGWNVLVLLPFFVARSLFALRFVQAFAYSDLRVLAELAAAALGGVVVVALLPKDEALVLGALTLVLAAAAGWVRAARRADAPHELATLPTVNLTRWLALTAAAPGVTRVWLLRFDRRLASYGKLCAALRRAVERGAFARLAADELLCCTSSELDERTQRAALVRAGGGCLTELHCLATAETGRAAIASAFTDPRLAALAAPDDGKRRRRSERSAELTPEAIGAALTDDFAREHPGCAMLSLTGESRNLRRPPARDVRQLIAAVWASGSARPPERIPGACVEGVAFAPLGEPRLLFVLPRSLPVETRARWRQRVERESVRASLGALGFRP